MTATNGFKQHPPLQEDDYSTATVNANLGKAGRPYASEYGLPFPNPNLPRPLAVPASLPGPADPSEVAFRCALAGIGKEEALTLTQRASGQLTPLPDPEALRRYKAEEDRLNRALAEARAAEADLPMLGWLSAGAITGLAVFAGGVLADAFALMPGVSQLENQSLNQAVLGGAAVSGSILLSHLGIHSRSKGARIALTAAAAGLVVMSGLARALMATTRGLEILGLQAPGTTQETLGAVGVQWYWACYTAAGSTLVGTAGLEILTACVGKIGKLLRARSDKREAERDLATLQSNVSAALQTRQTQLRDSEMVLAKAELAFTEGKNQKEARP